MDSSCIRVSKLVAINGDLALRTLTLEQLGVDRGEGGLTGECTTLARVVGWCRERMWEVCLFLPLSLSEESNGGGEELA